MGSSYIYRSRSTPLQLSYTRIGSFHRDLRALFQRKKGRDLFDLWTALEEGVDPSTVVEIFTVYVKHGGQTITRALFEKNLAHKIHLPAFTDDIPPLLAPGVTFDLSKAIERVLREMIALVPGEPWKGEPSAPA